MDPQQQRQPAVAVRRFRQRLLPSEVSPLGQGSRCLQLVHRGRRRHRPMGRRQWSQPAVPSQRLRRRIRPPDQPQQRQIRRSAERVHNGWRQRRPVHRLERRQPAVATRPSRHRQRRVATVDAVHQPGRLAGLRRHRHHSRRRHVLRLRFDDALLPRRPDPALLRPRQLGVRRSLRPLPGPVSYPATRLSTGQAASTSTTPTSTRQALSKGRGPGTPRSTTATTTPVC